MPGPEGKQAVVSLWDDGWTIARIAEHLGLSRGAVGVVVGDLLRERDAAKPAAAPVPAVRTPPRQGRPRRPRLPACEPDCPTCPPPAAPRRPIFEQVNVPLLTREGLAEIARRHGHQP